MNEKTPFFVKRKFWFFSASALLIFLLLVAVFIIISEEYVRKINKIPTTASADLAQKLIPAEKNHAILFVLADTGSGTEMQKNVAEAMEKECLKQKPDALLFLGDNFYEDGVNSVKDTKWQTHLLDVYNSACLKSVPIYAVLGNHDYDGNAQAQIDYTNHSDRWNMPFRFYKLSIENLAEITFIDNWFMNFCLLGENCTMNFLRSHTGQKHADKWQLVAGHYPVRTASAAGGGHTRNYKGAFLEYLLCRNNVDSYLAGHSHHLEFSKSGICDMDLVVSGGGGKELHPVQNDLTDNELFVKAVNGFTRLDITPSQLSYDYIDFQSQQIFSHQQIR